MRKLLFISLTFFLFYNSIVAAKINPYLQTPTSTSIIISWKSEAGLEQYVQYGLDTNLTNTVSGDYEMLDDDNLHTTWHSVKISSLSPNTTYYYKCITNTDESIIYTFHTQPELGQSNGHIRFTVIGDNRTYPDKHKMVIDGMVSKMTELYGEDYNKDINFMINVGDVVSNGWNLSEYKNEYFDPMVPLSSKIPTMVSIGNHENEASYFYQFMKYEELNNAQEENKEVYYHFQIGRCLFIAINSNPQHRTETQLVWLKEVLESAQNNTSIDMIFPFCHHPGRTETWIPGNTSYIQYDVMPMLGKYEKVEILLVGHTHDYERGAPINSNYFILNTSGGGGELARWREYTPKDYPEIQKSYDYYNYCIIDIDVENRSYVCDAYTFGTNDKYIDNLLLDSFGRKQIGNSPPVVPVAISNEQDIDLASPYFLSASDFIDADGDSILSSQFQITKISNDYKNLLLEIKRDYENIYWDTGAPDWIPIDKNAGLDITQLELTTDMLPETGTYFWRVRYRDRNLLWSDWSEENSINIINTEYIEIPQHNKSLDFSGDDYILLADSLHNAILPIDEITIETWVKFDNSLQNGGIIGAIQDNGSFEKGFILWHEGKSIQFGISTEGADDGDGTLTYLSGNSPLINNKWYHIAATYKSSEMKLYVNGIEMKSSSAQSGNILYELNSKFVIGAYYDDNENYQLDGELDEVRLWNKSLSPETIKKWVHKEIDSTHVNFENLLNYWSMNGENISGNIMYDKTYTGIMRDMNITNLKASKALIGYDGWVIDDQNIYTIGNDQIFLSANITSTPSSKHYLDIYQIKEDDGTFFYNDNCMPGIAKRYNIIWDINEIGENNKRGESVVADLIFNYSGLLDKCSTDSLLILRKPATDSVWQNITDKFIKDDGSHTFTTTGMDTLTGEYSFGIMSDVTSLDNESNIPNTYYLKQNYPNPFNASTTIEYGVKENSRINITIYNTRGQIVEYIINKIHIPGAYQMKWNCGDLSSGIYFIKMNADDSIIKINKSILLK